MALLGFNLEKSDNENELETNFDKWLYFLQNLDSFNSIPNILQQPIFIEAFKSAEIANFNEEEIIKIKRFTPQNSVGTEEFLP